MRIEGMCKWCHSMNDAKNVTCRECGHDAHKDRALCRCHRCRFATSTILAKRQAEPRRIQRSFFSIKND